MNITTVAKRAALRIATQHFPQARITESLLLEIAYEIQYAMDQRETESHYFIMQEDVKFEEQFWDGEKWTAGDKRKVYTNFDEATVAYRKAFLACKGKVTVAHVSPGGIVKYQPL